MELDKLDNFWTILGVISSALFDIYPKKSHLKSLKISTKYMVCDDKLARLWMILGAILRALFHIEPKNSFPWKSNSWEKNIIFTNLYFWKTFFKNRQRKRTFPDFNR